MMSSKLFKELSSRRIELEKLFLNFPTSDSYLQPNQDRIKAFIILMHSEIEYYFERFSDGVKNYITEPAKVADDYSKLPVDFFIYSTKRLDVEAEYDHHTKGKSIIKEFNSLIAKKNNGIKKINILTLLLPLGVKYVDIDLSLLNTLNDYGEKRCMFAHTGLKAHATRILDRDIENRQADMIVKMIEILDQDILNKYQALVI